MWKLLNSFFTPMEPVPQITADELKQILDYDKPLILIDVRSPAELTRGKLPGCINIPLHEFEAKAEQLIPDKQQDIYIYCLSGTRSDKAVGILMRKGYTSVKSLTNGMLMWRYKNYPIV